MTCREAEHLLDPYVDGELDGDLETRARAHFEACSGCEEQRRNRQRLQAILASTLGAEGREEASLWPQIADAIEAGGIAQAARAPSRRSSARRRGPTRQTGTARRRAGVATGLGIAAACLFAFAFLLGDPEPQPSRFSPGLAGSGATGDLPGEAEEASRFARLPESSPPIAQEEGASLLACEWPSQIRPGEVEFSGPMMSLWRDTGRE